MTYLEALKFKENKISPFNYNGVLMTIVIAPNAENDFNSFINYYKSNKVDDTSSQKFSMNDEYAVYGFGPRIEYFFYIKLF